MKTAFLRFYEELNDFLPQEKRKTRFIYEFRGTPSVKDVIESIGVPHTEVDMILVNGVSVGFNYNIRDNDSISVYPVFESFDISDIQHLRPSPLREPRFILDVHLGSLARYMRMAGFDALYANDFNDKEIIHLSLTEKRTVLTRDRSLLKNSAVTHGYFIRGSSSENQLKEVIRHFQLENYLNPFTRCIECNNPLKEISKEELEDDLPPKVRARQNEFKRCEKCGRTYWKGTHYEKMHSFIDNLKKSL
jgi:uncharacterized protein